MRYIELDNTTPNQEFNIASKVGTLFIKLRTVDNITLMSVSANGNNIVSSIKVAPNVLLLGYKYLQDVYGDFIFTTVEGEYPYYTNFNNANKLYYLDSEEVKEYNAIR